MAASRQVKFRGFSRYFDSQKEAYEWLIDKFLIAAPGILENEEHRHFICDGPGRRYLADRPQDLWLKSTHLVDEKLYKKMSNGWYLNTNLDEKTKLGVLRRFAKISGFQEDADWSWRP
jgi:hypothetical protein